MENSSDSLKRICYRCEDCDEIFMDFDTFEAHKNSSCTSRNGLLQTAAETVPDCCHQTAAETVSDCCHQTAAETVSDCCHLTAAETFSDCCHKTAAETVSDLCHQTAAEIVPDCFRLTALDNKVLVSLEKTECSSYILYNSTRMLRKKQHLYDNENLGGRGKTEESLRKELLHLDNETSHEIMRLNDSTKRLFKLLQDQLTFEYRLPMQRLWWAMEAKIFTFNRFRKAGAEIRNAVNSYIKMKHENEKAVKSSDANFKSKQTLSITASPQLICSNVTTILANIQASMEAEKSALSGIKTAIRNQKLAGEKVLEAAEKEEAVLITTVDGMAELSKSGYPSHIRMNAMHNLQSSLMECNNLLKTRQQDVEHCLGVISVLVDEFEGFSTNQKNENTEDGEASTSVTQQGMSSTDTVQEMDIEMDSC